RSDAWLYLTIRNGGGIMPPYGWGMNDTEMW
ncbi:MAG: cytochrome c, partial [Deltaproteobacteria bacterium]|nr:cytochrome c [Deltaproteobacteria bacterium]